MTTRLLVFVAVSLLCGCANNVPTWTKANAEARSSGMFIPDEAYYASQQFTNEMRESADRVFQLKQKLGHENATPAREKLEASMRSLQLVTATNSAQQQQAWQAQVYAASPNMAGKITTMISPINAKGEIAVVQIITYYDNGTMRYATNRFNKLK